MNIITIKTSYFPHNFILFLQYVMYKQLFKLFLFVFAGVWSGVEHQGQRLLPQHLWTSSAQIVRRLQSVCEDHRQGEVLIICTPVNVYLVFFSRKNSSNRQYKQHSWYVWFSRSSVCLMATSSSTLWGTWPTGSRKPDMWKKVKKEEEAAHVSSPWFVLL